MAMHMEDEIHWKMFLSRTALSLYIDFPWHTVAYNPRTHKVNEPPRIPDRSLTLSGTVIPKRVLLILPIPMVFAVPMITGQLSPKV